MPVHETTSAKGPLTCEVPTRPHGNPPYGKPPATASRAVHSPATSADVSTIRPRPRTSIGTHRYASEMSTAPPATKRASSTDRASQGSGPTHSAVKSTFSR